MRKRSLLALPPGLARLMLLTLPFVFFFACTSATSFSGSTPALPVGQVGSLTALGQSPGNCYVPGGQGTSSTTCSPTSVTPGSSGITALGTDSYGSSGSQTTALFFGDAGGNISFVTVPTTASIPTSVTSCVPGPGSSILSLAVIPGTSSTALGTLFYSTSGSAGAVYSLSVTSSTSSCGGSPTSVFSAPSYLTYSSKAGEVIGVTQSGSFFTCNSSSTPSCTSPTQLPNHPGSTIAGIAADPQYPVVYVTTSANGSYAIDIYSVNGANLLFLGSYSGGELSAPTGITVFHGPNPAQNYCTGTTAASGCNFLYVANAGTDAVTQYVLTYSLSSAGVPTGVSLNQFNAAYMGCDLFTPSAMAAISTPVTGAPAVFLGEGDTSFGPCMGVPSGTSFGKNVTAYTVMGE